MMNGRKSSARSTLTAATLAAAAFAAPAHAQTYTCALGASALNLPFGTYDPVSATPRTATTSLTLTCTHQSGGAVDVNWNMELSNGSSGTCIGIAGRTLRRGGSPADTLGYNVFIGSIAGGVWGNSGCNTFPAGTLRLNPGGNRVLSTTQTLYGQIPVNQYVSAGSYADLLVLTVRY
jgi:spore coat protein U-like protein